jgi:hypothetical protein
MNDMERRKFEDSFQDAFKDAEASPSENVWTNIELDLEKADGDKMKRRLVFFKTLAAASIVFALCVAGIGYYVFQRNDVGNIAEGTTGPRAISPQDQVKEGTNTISERNNNSTSPIEQEDGTASNSENLTKKSLTPIGDEAQLEKDESSAEDSRLARSSTEENHLSASNSNNGAHDGSNKEVIGGTVAKGTTTLIAADKNPNSTNPVVSQTTVTQSDNEKTLNPPSQNDKAALKSAGALAETNRKLPTFYQLAEPELRLPVSTADPGMLLLAKLADEEKKYASAEKNQTKKKTENLWTSIGFAAGGVNANNPSVAPVASNALYSMKSANTASTQSKASGLSYSVGVSVGTKLSNRWVLQGGINYLTQTYDYTANSVVVVNSNFAAPKAASLNVLFSPQSMDATANTTVAQTFPYNVNNNVRFVNVPLQAGYLVVNRKFGFQLNAGVSTDVFLQNTITPDGGGLSKTTQGSGNESPYRSLNFSGLMGTEFSYRLGDRYRLSLNPGLRYPFNSVYKSNTGVDSTPLTFDVGLRFRYIFH